MSWALLLMLALAPGRLALIDETFEVPAGEYRDIGLGLRQRPSVIDCRFEVVSGRSGVRVALLPKSELERMRAQKNPRLAASTAFEREGAFRVQVPAGDYALLLDNRLDPRQAAEVRVAVTVAPPVPPARPRELSSGRKLVIIAASLLFFFGVAAYSLLKIRRALARRDG